MELLLDAHHPVATWDKAGPSPAIRDKTMCSMQGNGHAPLLAPSTSEATTLRRRYRNTCPTGQLFFGLFGGLAPSLCLLQAKNVSMA